jgi:biotin carboxyl carrier protein
VNRAGLSAADLTDVLSLLAGTDITELEVTVGETRLSLRRDASLSRAMGGSVGSHASAEPVSLAIVSPLVGIFQPTVSAGQLVEPGQSLGAIAALGMPTSIDAPQAGTIEELLVQAGEPVEYGQPLLIMRRGGHAT